MLDYIINLFSGEGKWVFLIYFGIISFVVAFTISCLTSLLYGLKMNWYLQKHHFNIWKIPDGKSFKKSAEYGKAIKSINDPVLKRISAKGDKYSKLCLLIWFISVLVIFALVATLHFLGI